MFLVFSSYRGTKKTKTPATKAVGKVCGKQKKTEHTCLRNNGSVNMFFDLSCLVSTDVFLFVKRRSPFAGVVRTCYPLSMAFDGRLTEKSLIVLLLCYVGKVGCS